MELRKKEETEFHNKLRTDQFAQRWSIEAEAEFGSDLMWANMKYYAVERTSLTYIRKWLQQRCKDHWVLDYCCGNGEDSIRLGKDGAAKVVGIDLSDVSIQNCRTQAGREGVEGKTEFLVMDAEALGFDDSSFDVIVVYGALHHLSYEKAMSELARVIKPDGAIICTEALKHNPIIHLYRKMTPHLRTAWEVEHIMTRQKLIQAEKYFDEVQFNFFHLATLAAVPFRKRKIFIPMLSFLESVDKALLKLPFLKWWAWIVVFTLSKPKKGK